MGCMDVHLFLCELCPAEVSTDLRRTAAFQHLPSLVRPAGRRPRHAPSVNLHAEHRADKSSERGFLVKHARLKLTAETAVRADPHLGLCAKRWRGKPERPSKSQTQWRRLMWFVSKSVCGMFTLCLLLLLSAGSYFLLRHVGDTWSSGSDSASGGRYLHARLPGDVRIHRLHSACIGYTALLYSHSLVLNEHVTTSNRSVEIKEHQ